MSSLILLYNGSFISTREEVYFNIDHSKSHGIKKGGNQNTDVKIRIEKRLQLYLEIRISIILDLR